MRRRIVFICASLAALPVSAPARDREPPASTVLIAGSLDRRPAYASGVIVAEAGGDVTIATARHNLEIEHPQYLTAAGERLVIRATAAIAGSDQALVTARRPQSRYAVAVISNAPPAGTRVTIWGPIERDPFTQHHGSTRALDDRITDAPVDAVAIDCAACDHGDSGAGVYDDDGRLVGIITRGYFAGKRKLLVLVERIRPDTLAAVPPPR